MKYALIRESDGLWLSPDPLGVDEEPTPGPGEYVITCPFGIGETCLWQPSPDRDRQGFVDIVVPSAILSPLAYQRRFTQAERIAIRASTDVYVIDWRELAGLAAEIDLDDADVIAGTNYLETLGLIGTGRAAEILTI